MNQKLGKIIFLTLLCLYSLFFVIGSTLAPIMAHFEQYEISAILTSTYIFSCHQQPDRSFWLMGYPIALCCRCYGVYIGTAVSCIFAIFDKLNIAHKIILVMLFLSAIDIFINYGTGTLRNTGNIIRFIVGLFMGILFTTGLNYIFNLKRRIKNEN